MVMEGGWRYSGDGGWVEGTVVMEGGWRYSGDGGWVEGTVVMEGGWIVLVSSVHIVLLDQC